jgi:short-subunit dehydrogenase
MGRRRYPPAGKAILLTGASRGLVQAIAVALAHKGARLALTARDEAGLQQTAALCRAAGAEVHLLPADLTDEAACRRVVDVSVAALGGLDILIANAGQSMWAPFEQVTDLSVYASLVQINYLSVVALTHAALPHLVRSHGAIVAVSTAQAWTGMPLHTGYAASKAALQAFLDSLAMEQGDCIHILGIYPGWIRDTILRAAALGADGAPLRQTRASHSSLSVSPEACADSIVRSLEKGRSMDFVPNYMRLLYAARPFAYPLIQRILSSAVSSQKSSHK